MGAKRAKKKQPRKDRGQADGPVEPTQQRRAPAGRYKFFPILIVLAGIAAYFNSFAGVFLFDDSVHILTNERIRQLWPVWDILACRRPVVELSLAINYALGQHDVWGYHLFNLTVHILAALTLNGVVRRTLTCEALSNRFGASSSWLALIVALIWLVHPLQTQAVDYIIQRGESLMGLFYLLTLYCVIRSADSSKRRWWYAAALVAGVMGMGSKAVMVTAPAAVLLYDRTFLSGSFAEALRRRWALYTGLTATWFTLVLCGVVQGVLDPSREFATVGFSFRDFTWMQYALSQPGAILQYLKLALWPHPLCLDYGADIATSVGAIAGPAIVVALLLAVTVWAFLQRPHAGFVGVWFFVILAPTSSVIPIKDVIFEHRMYLSLAGVVALLVVGGHSILKNTIKDGSLRRMIGGGLAVAIVATLGYATIRRNEDYHDGIGMWENVLAQRPNSARAHHNLANAFSFEKRFNEAIEEYRTAIRLGARNPKAYANLGISLAMQGSFAEAEEQLRSALRVKPGYVEARVNLGNVLRQAGRPSEAIPLYRRVLRRKPNSAEASTNLSVALGDVGQLEEAIQMAQRAVQIRPDFPEGYMNLGLTLVKSRRAEEAVEAYRMAIRLKPDFAEAYANMGLALGPQGKIAEAMDAFRTAIQLRPDFAEPHHHMGFALMRMGKIDEAIAEFRTALRMKPRFPEASYKLGNALSQQGRFDEAVQAYRNALSLAPDHAEAHAMLAISLARSGRHAEAVEEFRAAIRIRPGQARWHANLGHALTAQGLVNEAVAEFTEALRLDPRLERAQQALDALLAKSGGSSTP